MQPLRRKIHPLLLFFSVSSFPSILSFPLISATTTSTTLLSATTTSTALFFAHSSSGGNNISSIKSRLSFGQRQAKRNQVSTKMIRAMSSSSSSSSSSSTSSSWSTGNEEQAKEALEQLEIAPLDEYNVQLLNEVHPRNYKMSCDEPHEIYDLIAIGAGAGGLVSSKQSARRGAKSCMVSEYLAGGDCLNVGCVPSKALIRAGRAIKEVKRCSEFGVVVAHEVKVDFSAIMKRMRRLRAQIAPADGHDGTAATSAHVFQGRGRFVGPNEIQVSPQGIRLKFKKAVIATGGRPSVPTDIPGLQQAPFTTNENLFNLETLPPRMLILGAGVIALEMAQTFQSFGTQVTVLQRSKNRLFQSKQGDAEAAELIQTILEEDGVQFLLGSTIQKVTTIRDPRTNHDADATALPLMSVMVSQQQNSNNNNDKEEQNVINIECECLLVASGRVPNVEDLGLEAGNIDYKVGSGILVNDLAQSTTNPNVYAVGDCVANVPRFTHMSGEMAKLVVQNGLFDDDWKLSSLVVPSCMYTEPEYATTGLVSSEEMAISQGIPVDVYKTSLEHNDRAILEGESSSSSSAGFVKIFTKKDSDEILGATIVANRAGDMINEISLAIKHKIGLRGIGRNIHCYPTTGEAIMGCGIQYINSKWKRLS